MNNLNFEKRNPIREVRIEDFTKLSELLEKKLPKSYIDFYSLSNGGIIEESFIYDEEDGEEVFGVSVFYSLISDTNEFNDVDNVFIRLEKNFLENSLYVPLGRDGAGNELYLDFNEHEPTVCVCFYDDPDEAEGTPFTHVELFSTFDEFLQELEVYRGE